jgi:hypothetical protein
MAEKLIRIMLVRHQAGDQQPHGVVVWEKRDHRGLWLLFNSNAQDVRIK